MLDWVSIALKRLLLTEADVSTNHGQVSHSQSCNSGDSLPCSRFCLFTQHSTAAWETTLSSVQIVEKMSVTI